MCADKWLFLLAAFSISVPYMSVRFLSRYTCVARSRASFHHRVCVCVCVSSVIKHFHMHRDHPVCAPCHPGRGIWIISSHLSRLVCPDSWSDGGAANSACATELSDLQRWLVMVTQIHCSHVFLQLNQNGRGLTTTSWCLLSRRRTTNGTFSPVFWFDRIYSM